MQRLLINPVQKPIIIKWYHNANPQSHQTKNYASSDRPYIESPLPNAGRHPSLPLPSTLDGSLLAAREFLPATPPPWPPSPAKSKDETSLQDG